MTSEASRSTPAGLRLGRRVIQQLRASLERDAGLQAATHLQEAGFAGGEELYNEFAGWLAERYDVQQGDYPSCHLSCGLLADFLGRLSQGAVAVMEVECRTRGDGRCRFLAGAPESLSIIYDRMAQGSGYLEALAG
jgi:hypothetical protein